MAGKGKNKKKTTDKKESGGKKKVEEVSRKVYGRIRPCVCEHAFQDKEYGKGMRLHTEAKTGTPGSVKFRCTVCAAVKGG